MNSLLIIGISLQVPCDCLHILALYKQDTFTSFFLMFFGHSLALLSWLYLQHHDGYRLQEWAAMFCSYLWGKSQLPNTEYHVSCSTSDSSSNSDVPIFSFLILGGRVERIGVKNCDPVIFLLLPFNMLIYYGMV